MGMRVLFNNKIYHLTAKIKLFLIVMGIVLFVCSCLGYKAINTSNGSFVWVIFALLLYPVTFWISVDGCCDDLSDYAGEAFSSSFFLWAVFIIILLASHAGFRLIFEFFYWCFT